MEVLNAVEMSHRFIEPLLAQATLLVDATAGNGNDTLFLARMASDNAKIWAFDVQSAAIEKTRALLVKHDVLSKVTLVAESHEMLAAHVLGGIDAVMFNLGYLPGASRNIITRPQSTTAALKFALKQLNPGGRITIVAYPGFLEGAQEETEITRFLATLDQLHFTVASWSMLNQRNQPPRLYVVEKRRSERRETTASRKN
ncbi:MAG TPA: class I SAM-dependent methyltransferase [Patescibacteria group bacterium]|nr:class I SAM-dependent methyltransferase [Patescibacteria group bacterium]